MQAHTAGFMEERVPLYVPCRKLSLSAPFRWLKMGWQDFQRAPKHSLVYGTIFVITGWLLLYFAWAHENDAMVISLLFGFLVMGPVLSFGLYDISHQLELGHEPAFRHERQKAIHEMGHELMFAMLLIMMFVILTIVLSIVAGVAPGIGMETVSFATPPLLVAAISAGLVFCASAFGLPMILHKDVDAATAIITSTNAVLRNKRVSLVWALLIFVLTAIGFATALIGLAFIVPVLGYATWHAYRETIITNGVEKTGKKARNTEGQKHKVSNMNFEVVKISVEGRNLDFILAKRLGEDLASGIASDPVMIAWFDGKKGEEHPQVPECQHKPGWLAYAEGHGGRIRVDVNKNEYSFIFADSDATSD